MLNNRLDLFKATQRIQVQKSTPVNFWSKDLYLKVVNLNLLKVIVRLKYTAKMLLYIFNQNSLN